MKLGRFVVLASADGTEPWKPVPPDQVPLWLKDPITFGRIANGEIAQDGPDGEWYRADKVEESLIVLPPERGFRHKPAVLDAVKQ